MLKQFTIWLLLLSIYNTYAQSDETNQTKFAQNCAQRILTCEQSPKAVRALQNIFLCFRNFETSPGNNKIYRQCVLDNYHPSPDNISSVLRFDDSLYLDGGVNWKPYVQIIANCAEGCFDETAYDNLKQCYEKMHSESAIVEISCW